MVARSFEAVSAADFLKAANPHVRVVSNPVAKAGCRRRRCRRRLRRRTQGDPFLRAENEDDDGYDPYSDRREEAPLFEASPWDWRALRRARLRSRIARAPRRSSPASRVAFFASTSLSS